MSKPVFKVHSTAPDAYIVFFPYLQEKTPGADNFDPSYLETKSIFVRSELISVSTSKPKTGMGSWSATVASSKNYKALIHQGCWAMIYISDQQLDQPNSDLGVGKGLKMLGQVKSVRCIEVMDASSGTKSVRYEFAGVDFHTVLESQVYINRIITGSKDPKTSPIVDALVLFKQYLTQQLSPDESVRSIIEAVLGKKESLDHVLNSSVVTAGGVYAIPPKVAAQLTGAPAADNKFIEVLDLKLQPALVGKICLQPDLGGMFSCWSLAQTYSHRILNELYTDLMPVDGILKPTVVLRAIPFSSPPGSSEFTKTKSIYDHRDERIDGFKTNSMMSGKGTTPNDLGLYISRSIEEHEIMGLNYGKSDSERFNFFFVLSNTAIQNGMNGAKLYELTNQASIQSLGDPNSLARHGIRPYITTSDYLNLSDDHIIQVNTIARDLWSRAHLYENGTVTIIGSAHHIPVGTNILLKDRGWLAHVERVDHSYSVGATGRKNYSTSIAFVRMQTLNGEPIDLIEKSNEHDWDREVSHSLGSNLTNGRAGDES